MRLLTVLILILPLSLLAQVKTSKEFNVDVGLPYPVVDAGVKEYFYYNDQVLSVKIGGEYTVQKFDAKTLQEKSRFSMSKKKEMVRGFVHEEFVQQGGTIYEFYNVWDKPNETEQIFVQKLTFDNLKPSESKLLLKTQGKMTSAMGADKIDVYQSFDQSHYCLVYRRKPEEKRDKLNYDKIGILVLDAEMNEVWQNQVVMPYTEAEMDNLGYTVDSKGNVFLLARIKTDETVPLLQLIKYSKSGDPQKIDIIADGKFFPHGITIKEGVDGEILCGGFYGEGRSANGIYLCKVTQDGVITNEQFYDIPLEIINQNKSDRAQAKNEKRESKGQEVGIYELDLDDIITQEDGSVLLLGEVYYVTQTTTYNPSTKSTTTTYHYHYLEMFMTKINANAEVVWMKKLPKNQYRSSSSGGYYRVDYDLSYKYLQRNGKHYLMYLDNVKNLQLALNEYPERHASGRGGYLTAYEIDDATGDIRKLSLFDLTDVKGISMYQFNTDRIIQASDDEVLLELYKKKKEDIMIRIEVTE